MAVLIPAVTATPVVAAEIAPFKKVYDKAFYGDFETVGNGVLDCPTTADEAACRAAQADTGSVKNNNTFVMTNKDMAGLGGFNSASADVTVPAGATVDYARLSWGGHNGKYGYSGGSTRSRCDGTGDVTSKPNGSPESTKVRVKVDGDATETVAPEVFNQSPTSDNGPQYYGAEADITSMFGSTGSGSTTVAVGDVWAPTGLGCAGGWALTVVYKYTNPDPDSQNMHNFYVYSGLVVQRSKDKPTNINIDGFYAAAGADSHASVVAYEGDRGTPGDRFLVNGTNIVEPEDGNTRNFFVSDSHGQRQPKNSNNLNIDAKSFDLPNGTIPTGSTSAKLTLETSGDSYVAQQVAFAVPVPDLEVTKTSTPEAVYAGDTVTYTVKVKNISNLDYPNAKASDDLTDVLDDGVVGEPTATSGDVEFKSPKIKWTGDVAAGATETITYKVKVNDPVSGDGKLINNVVAPGARPTTCDWHLTIKECKTSQTIKDADDKPDSPSATPGDKPSGKPAADAENPDNLSITGGSYTVPILIALALVIAGLATLWFMRRRTRKAEAE